MKTYLKRLLVFIPLLVLMTGVLFAIRFAVGGDPGEDEVPPMGDTPPIFESDGEWVYAKIEYRDDLIAPNRYFMLLSAPIPEIYDGYAQTDSYAEVILRGVSVARAMHQKAERNRPHDWVTRERERFNAAMSYVWNLTNPKHTFRIGNIEVVEEDVSLLADVEYYLGGEWHNLAISMLNDKHAYLSNPENQWEFGDTDIGFVNPNLPK